MSLSLELTIRLLLDCRMAMLPGMQDELYNPDHIETVTVTVYQ